MADYAVSTAFTGKDGVTDQLKAMAVMADKFGTEAKQAFGKASHAGLSFKKLVGGILASNLVTSGIGYLKQGIQGALESYVEFDDAVTAAAAHFDSGYSRNTQMFKELGAAAREVGATTEYTSAQAAKGLDFLAKAGLSPILAMKTLKSYVDLATASAEEFESATSMAVDIMGAFRLNTGTAEEQIVKYNRANDTLVKIVNMSNLGLEDLFETIKYSGPIAVDAGVSLEKFGAIAALVGGAGIKGSQAGTAMKNALMALTGQTKKVRDAFAELHVKFQDTKGNVRDPIAVFEDLRKKMDKLGSAKRLRILGDIFGMYGISGASVSIAGGMAALDKYEQALKDASGESAKTADLMRQSLGKRLAALKSAAIELAFKFIDAFEKKIPGGIDKLAESIRNFDVKPTIEAVKAFGEGLSKACEIAKELTPLMVGLGTSFVAYKTIMTGIDAYEWFTKLTGAIKAAGSAQKYLNLMLLANPIGAVVVAVGLLATATYMLYKRWDDIKEIWKWLGEKWDAFAAKYPVLFGEQSWDPEKALEKPAVKAAEKKVEESIGPKPFVNKYGNPSIAPYNLDVPAFRMAPSILPKAAPSSAPEKAKTVGPQSRTAPNRNDVLAANINFTGRLDIAGAPEGSKLQSRTIGAPPIRTDLIGANV